MQALEELYAENCVNKEAITKKSQEWLASVEEFHSAQISDPKVAGNHFSRTKDMDVIPSNLNLL